MTNFPRPDHDSLYHSGVDFDDPEFGFKEEDKDSSKVSLCLSSSEINTHKSRLRTSQHSESYVKTAAVSLAQCRKLLKHLAFLA